MSLTLPEIHLPVSLRRLFPQCSFVGCADILVTDATERSSLCRPHSLFAALQGSQTSGAKFVGEAIGRGATALLVDRPIATVAVPQCVVPGVNHAYARLCEALAGDPSRRINVAGVTGTNGKTTTTWLIRSILQAAGRRTGLLGTIEYSDGIDSQRSSLTTPDSKTCSQWLAAMLGRGATHAAIELSSHALHQSRAAGVQLAAAVVTNVTHDHFDYHADEQAYWVSKTRIIERVRHGGLVVLNADDPGSRAMSTEFSDSHKLMMFGIDEPADVSAENIEETPRGSRFTLNIAGERVEVVTPLVARHNISNCLAAATVAWRFGVSLSDIAQGIAALKCVPGRMESIDQGQPFRVVVDYAHTEDALERCLLALHELTPGRVFCVFGAGGDRDRSKRPLMGAAAALADVPVITSDNPRSENPHRIIDDIVAGLPAGAPTPYIESDRALAIRWALQEAEPGDCVLVAGKGHETEQIMGSSRLPFDDREVVRRLLTEIMSQPYERVPVGVSAWCPTASRQATHHI